MLNGGWFWCMNGLWVYYANISFPHHHMWCESPSRKIHIFSQFLPGPCFGAIFAYIVYPVLQTCFSEAFAHRWFRNWFSVETTKNDVSNGIFSRAAELSVSETEAEVAQINYK